VGALGNYYDMRDHVDFTPWLEYSRTHHRRIAEVARSSKGNRFPEKELKSYHRKIIGHIKKHGYITDANMPR